MSIVKYFWIILLLYCINFTLSAQNFSFGHSTIYNEAVYTQDTYLYESIEIAMTVPPEDVIALKLHAATKNMLEIKKFVNLRFLILDDGFTANSFYLSSQALNSFFLICDQLPILEYIAINDSKLIPYIKSPEKIKGLRISIFDQNTFNFYAPQFKNLQLLIIDDNSVVTLSDDICNLTSLRQLELYTESLPVLPANIGALQNLEVLNLLVGKIKVLPPSFASLKNLRYLSLKGLVNFKKMPLEICRLKALEELHFELRNIAYIPDELGQLARLKALLLFDCNKLEALPATLSGLSHLEYIYISGRNNNFIDVNALTQFDRNFSLMLVKCDYARIARQLQTSTKLDEFIVPSGILPSELKTVEKYIPPHKIIKQDI